jgi:hypothetical protein
MRSGRRPRLDSVSSFTALRASRLGVRDCARRVPRCSGASTAAALRRRSPIRWNRDRAWRSRAEIGADLVHVVEREQRVRGFRPAHGLDDGAGHRAHLGGRCPRTRPRRTPPSDTRTNSRPVARAIDLPPTPRRTDEAEYLSGQLVGALLNGRYSTIHSLTFSGPSRPSPTISWASSRSFLTAVFLFHGIHSSQSI